MRRVCADLVTRESVLLIRKTRQLYDLSSAMIDSTGEIKPKASLPPDGDNDGVAPALLEDSSRKSHMDWLAKRIVEIERFVRQFPSVAIFVSSEAEVQPLAHALNSELQEQNFCVVPCPHGQVVGHQNEIRVLDVQHIKGPELEAVFFADLAQLSQLEAWRSPNPCVFITGTSKVGTTFSASSVRSRNAPGP